MLYVCIDVWIERRIDREKSIKVLLIIFFIFLFFSWSILEVILFSFLLFMKEDVIEFVISGEGMDIDLFFDKVGMWKGMFEGYYV